MLHSLELLHPLQHGHVLFSPGCHFSYRVIGPCCRLFDREQLPWPCCRLQWRGKEPSWRRIGKRFVLDMASRGHPTYTVEILEQGRAVLQIPQGSRRQDKGGIEPMILTLYWVNLPPPIKEWWCSDRVRQAQ